MEHAAGLDAGVEEEKENPGPVITIDLLGKLKNFGGMQSYDNPFVVAEAPADARATFYRKTYGLVAVAFLGWVLTLFAIFAVGMHIPILNAIMSLGSIGWVAVLGLFWIATSVAQSMAFSRSSRATQYMGLAIYVVAEAIIFVPLIAIVLMQAGGSLDTAFREILGPAGGVTALLITGLTVTVFMTRTDFSFLKTAVVLGSFAALGVIIVVAVCGLSLGAWFSMAMVALMAAAILWQTWKVKNECDTDQYVGAAVVLFAGFITMLWYVIRLFMSRRS
ncbi:MAG: Bax inhibitor-1 family protein [Puniceicoccales bacterium]|nr:Bax inhibitor-1 family protein [Puniceicoccales bacterium]